MFECVSVKYMAACDRAAIAGGTPGTELMRRVGEALWRDIRPMARAGKRVCVLCGKGNNGGDGLALAEVMANAGYTAEVYLTDDTVSEDAARFLIRLEGRCKAAPVAACDYNADCIVDCVFGTGFRGTPDARMLKIFERVNKSKAHVISADIPSGLNGDSGLQNGCIRADMTLAVQCAKFGHFLGDGKDFCGEIRVADIGIPLDLPADGASVARICRAEDWADLFPLRKNNSNKGSYGKALLAGGSARYPGALRLAAAGCAALRTGAGLCALAVPKTLAQSPAAFPPDCTIVPMPERDGCLSYDESALEGALTGVSAAAVGMGAGDRYGQTRLLIAALTEREVPLIADADGLNALAEDLSVLRGRHGAIALTPHPKEMARLTGKTTAEILQAPVDHAARFAREFGVVVLLKGASTVITDGEKTYLMKDGLPAMAKGGNGDVLSGVICGLAAQGHDLLRAAAAGSAICAAAARRCAERFGEYGVLASDTAAEIGEAVREIAGR